MKIWVARLTGCGWVCDIYTYIHSSSSEHYLYHLHYPPVAETGTGEACELECQD